MWIVHHVFRKRMLLKKVIVYLKIFMNYSNICSSVFEKKVHNYKCFISCTKMPILYFKNIVYMENVHDILEYLKTYAHLIFKKYHRRKTYTGYLKNVHCVLEIYSSRTQKMVIAYLKNVHCVLKNVHIFKRW